MPTVRKLSPEEVQIIERRGKGESQRQLIVEQYDELLSEFGAGDYVEVELDEGEQPFSVRYHLRQAAARRGLSLNFQRTIDGVLSFQVIAGDAHGEK